MKIIGDAFANDRKIDEDLDARSEHIRKLKIVQGDARKAVNESLPIIIHHKKIISKIGILNWMSIFLVKN